MCVQCTVHHVESEVCALFLLNILLFAQFDKRHTLILFYIWILVFLVFNSNVCLKFRLSLALNNMNH